LAGEKVEICGHDYEIAQTIKSLQVILIIKNPSLKRYSRKLFSFIGIHTSLIKTLLII